METYSIAGFTFVKDGTDVDVMYGEQSVALFFVPASMSRQDFIAECESYFATEMVWS